MLMPMGYCDSSLNQISLEYSYADLLQVRDKAESGQCGGNVLFVALGTRLRVYTSLMLLLLTPA